ncbi:MAG: hypothetical protein AAB929_03180 [Patescibacteria group bacterium]
MLSLRESRIQTIPLQKMRLASIALSSETSAHLFDNDIHLHKDQYWKRTFAPLTLMLKLFNSNSGYSKIEGNSHKARQAKDDMLCAFSPFISTSLGIYVKEDGSTSFSLRDEYGRAISAKYEAPKVPSTNTKLGDAMLVAKFLKSFKDNARSQVKIDGPTEEEPYVVMTTPDVAKIGDYGKGQEIIGLIFRPKVQGNNRAVHGDVQLLVRDKIVAKV